MPVISDVLVDIARYQSNFSEYEGKSLKKE